MIKCWPPGTVPFSFSLFFRNLSHRKLSSRHRFDDIRPGQGWNDPQGEGLRGASRPSGGIRPEAPLRCQEREAPAQLLSRNGGERVPDVNIRPDLIMIHVILSLLLDTARTPSMASWTTTPSSSGDYWTCTRPARMRNTRRGRMSSRGSRTSSSGTRRPEDTSRPLPVTQASSSGLRKVASASS